VDSQPTTPEWQTAAGGKMAFDTATVRQNTTEPPGAGSANFPLGPGDVYMPNRGFFRAYGFLLATYIEFAYKITPNQEEFLLSQLPKWVTTEQFDIEARAEGNPTKDQMRLMMQALLADRFRLAAHYETRQIPVFALILDRPGELGPQLQKHADESPCPTTSIVPSPAPTAQPQLLDARYPATCGGMLAMPPSTPGRLRGGARNVTMELIASSLKGGGSGVDRPVLNRTGLTGKFDFAIEFAPQYGAGLPASSNFRPDPTGPTFEQALKEQLGLKLESQMGPADFLVIDYIETHSAN
jgi:uncharacterized protein (TIGR03435 family)